MDTNTSSQQQSRTIRTPWMARCKTSKQGLKSWPELSHQDPPTHTCILPSSMDNSERGKCS
eukprot:4478229-Amphidinium_carterae.2